MKKGRVMIEVRTEGYRWTKFGYTTLYAIDEEMVHLIDKF